MKINNVLEALTPKERMTLARFYDTDAYKVLRKMVDIERIELAKDHVNEVDMLRIRHLSGQSDALKRLIGTLKKNYTEMDKGKD